MKGLLFRLLFAILCIAIFSFRAQAAPVVYTIDPMHSYVQWQISHFGYSYPSGKWFVNGTLDLDKDHPQNSKVNVTIDLAQMDTGIPKLDEHLRSKDFFDTSVFPTAVFVSQKIEVTGKDTAKVYGTLSLHGVSRPIVLQVKLNKFGEHPVTHKMTAGFSAKTQLDRSDFNIKAYLPNLGDTVKINIQVEAFVK